MQEGDPALNPLLDFSGLARFSQIRAEHIGPALDYLLADNRSERERLFSHEQTACTWDNLLQPLTDLDERLQRMWSPVSHLNAVCSSDAWRRAYNEGRPHISEYQTETQQDERIYRGLKEIAARSDFSRLQPAQQKIIENALRDFRLHGAELDVAGKQRFRNIQQELSRLGSRFADNVLDATDAWELVLSDERELAGLPEIARAMGREAAKRADKPGYRFTLEAPSYTSFMTFADRRELREHMYEAYVTRASDVGPHAGRWDNSEIIVEILRRRREAAHLLGFGNYADYALQTRMVKQVEQVLRFLRDLAARARSLAQRELDELQTFARELDGRDRLQAWDIAYYSEKLRQHRYQLSQEDLRPYFPVERVIDGMYEIVQRLYGITITRVDGVDLWHPDVRFYEIRDTDGELRGRFYMDLYARAHKRGGAWMDEYISRKRTPQGLQTPVAYITCNGSPPLPDRPALFTHQEVLTLLHEFGHGLHHLLTKVDYVGAAGINGVPWDAVELPSQFMENWGWQREALALMARHYLTGEQLPAALFAKLARTRTFQAGMQMVRQLEFALFDMRLHSEDDIDGAGGVQHLIDEVRQEVAVVVPPAYNRFQDSFSHIFAGGYAGGYYSYKWAEVLSADAFAKFEQNGIFDRRTGLEFLRNILEPGGSRDPLELFIAFRGRPPEIDALLRQSGLIK
jgi:oligopeptidase A